MIKGIVFDLDGTLVDSLAHTIEAFNQGIVKFGGRRHTAQEIMQYFGPGEAEIFAQIVGRENAEAAYLASRDYMDAHMGEIPLHSGIDDLLEKIKSASLPVSIFTGRSWETTEMILKHHRLLDRFVTVVAHDHVSMPKPSPEGLILAVTRMNLEPKEVLFVGDSPTDIMAGNSAGSRSAAALWDLLAKRSVLEPYQPRHWATQPSEIWDLVKESQ